MSDSPYITHATAETFAACVLDQSYETPVIVDFWADWCQPCKMLIPVLTQLAESYQGAVHLVKVNTDEQDELAAQYGIRSLPTVKLFKNGEVVDEFMGVQPETTIREMIDKHRVREGAVKHEQALALFDAGESEQAEALLTEILADDPDYHAVSLDLVSMLLSRGKITEADALLHALPEDIQQDEQAKALIVKAKMLHLKQQAGEGADSATLRQQLTENPDDLETVLMLANAELADEQYEQSLALFFQLMKKDDSYKDQAGRKGLLSVFGLLVAGHPLIKQYRNKMFSLMH
jgi:putative thioredoxin